MKPLSIACVIVIVFLGDPDFYRTRAGATADHLVPVEKEQGAAAVYERLWREKLLVTTGELARFVGLPGNVGEETSVSVYRRTKKKEGDKYWVTATQASSRLWTLIERSDKKQPLNAEAVSVQRCDATLPESTALAIHQVWIAMLSQARKEPKSESIAVDSSTEIFSAVNSDGKLLQGQFSSEPGKNSSALLQIAFSLMEYCDTPAHRQEDKAREIEKEASNLLNRVSKH